MSSLGVLETRIRAILQSTPLERFNTISAKDVRTRLLADGAVDEGWVKQNKKALNALIAGVFEQVSASLVLPPPSSQQTADVQPKEEEGVAEDEEYGYANGATYSDDHEGTQSQSGTGDFVDEEEAGPSTPPRKSSSQKRKTKRELTDEELARQLSTELNGRSSRSSRSGKAPPKSKARNNNKKGGSRTPKRGKKSADYVDDSDGGGGISGGVGRGGRGRASDSDNDSDNDDYGDSDGGQRRMSKTNKRRKTTRKSSGGGEAGGGSGRAKGGFGKEFILSAPLSALLEVDRLSRPQVVKQLWEYIKGNDLQNPSNRREILCDDRLRPVFNADKIDMFRMNKVLGQHLHEVE